MIFYLIKFQLLSRFNQYFDLKILYVQEPRRRRSYNGVLAIPHVVRPVETITQAELNNICTNVREKVYNRATVSYPDGSMTQFLSSA